MGWFHPLHACDIRRPSKYGGIKYKSLQFSGIGLIGVKLVYLFHAQSEEVDKGNRRINPYNCRIYVDTDGFLRRFTMYDLKGELIYRDDITKMIKKDIDDTYLEFNPGKILRLLMKPLLCEKLCDYLEN